MCTKHRATSSAVLCGSVLFFRILQKEIYKLSVILSMPCLGSELPLGAGQTFTVVYYIIM